MRLFRTLTAAAAGAAVAYLFDPERGKGRRARLKDQLAAEGRKTMRDAEKQARYQTGRMKGAVAEHMPSGTIPRSDADLLQKVRSEAVGPADFPTEHIEIHVEDGVVVLGGTLHAPGAERDLIDRIRQVDGVVDIRNELVLG